MYADRDFQTVKQMLEPCLQVTRQYQELTRLCSDPTEDACTGLSARVLEAHRKMEKARQPVYLALKTTGLTAMEFRVVVSRYLHAKKWEQIVEEMDRTRRHVLRLHSSALHRIAQTMHEQRSA